MNEEQIKKIEKEFNIKIDDEAKGMLSRFIQMFKEYNAHTNLISKNDVAQIFEKHIFDSFGILKIISANEKLKIVDIGTGGGFPSIILAICIKNFNVVALDSIHKKIKFIENVKNELNLENLTTINERSENAIAQKADVVCSRAVGRILKVYEFSKFHIKHGGAFVIYKAQNYNDELLEFKQKYPKMKEKIEFYELPTSEAHKRCVISFEKS